MKIEFSIPYPLNKVMSNGITHEDYVALRKWKVAFEERWRKKERAVLREIARLSGFGWKEKVVTCYILKDFPVAGVSYPLIIRQGVMDRRIRILVHELIHVNTPDKFLTLDKDIKDQTYFHHVSVYLVYNEIMSKFFPSIKKYNITDLENDHYKKAIDKSIELRETWLKSGLDMFDFMKKCMRDGLV